MVNGFHNYLAMLNKMIHEWHLRILASNLKFKKLMEYGLQSMMNDNITYISSSFSKIFDSEIISGMNSDPPHNWFVLSINFSVKFASSRS